MLDPDRLVARAVAFVGRVERREVAALRRWLEDTDNLLHLTVAVAVPLLIGAVTYISRTVGIVQFLLFPPLASGTYTLFADPEGRYSTPRRFVGGLTVGAASGWVALESARLLGDGATALVVSAPTAALAVFLTALVTWAVDLEFPTAFSAALLVLTTGTARLAYVGGMVLSATLVAAAFVVWRDRFYERRAEFLYGAVRGDDHVLVPVGSGAEGGDRPTVALAARLAGAHDAGKVVLLDVVGDERIAAAERALLAEHDAPLDRVVGGVDAAEEGGRDADGDVREAATRRAADEAAERLEREAARVRDLVDVPCEAVVATGDPVRATLATADEAGCDLVVMSLDAAPGSNADAADTGAGAAEGDARGPSPLVRGVFGERIDAAALRSRADRESWDDVLVLVGRDGDVAHAMTDFATRLAGESGHVALCSCVATDDERRRAETRLANLAETADAEVEIRVSRAEVEEFLDAAATDADLVVVGSSGDRSRASRLFAPPTYRRVADRDADYDVLVVD